MLSVSTLLEWQTLLSMSTSEVGTTADRSGTGSYHHRDLRSSLLEHGIALAREGGPAAVSLRDVQRRAGVSNSAAYRHYADRQALLAAIAAYALTEMAERMQAAIARVRRRGSPQEAALARFRATGASYLQFALTEPGLFRTAFLTDLGLEEPEQPAGPDQTGDQPPRSAIRDPYALLVRCLDELVEAGVLAAERRGYSDVAAWAAVHGMAVLLLDGPMRALPPAERKRAIDRLLDVVEAGMR